MSPYACSRATSATPRSPRCLHENPGFGAVRGQGRAARCPWRSSHPAEAESLHVRHTIWPHSATTSRLHPSRAGVRKGFDVISICVRLAFTSRSVSPSARTLGNSVGQIGWRDEQAYACLSVTDEVVGGRCGRTPGTTSSGDEVSDRDGSGTKLSYGERSEKRDDGGPRADAARRQSRRARRRPRDRGGGRRLAHSGRPPRHLRRAAHPRRQPHPRLPPRRQPLHRRPRVGLAADRARSHPRHRRAHGRRAAHARLVAAPAPARRPG